MKARSGLILLGVLALGIVAINMTEPDSKTGQIETVKPPAAPSQSSLIQLIQKTTASTDVKLTSQVENNKTYLADIRIARDPFTGGPSDWNSAASETFNYSKILLADPAIVRLHFTYYSPQNKNIDWAHLWIDGRKLPANWKDSYLLFFSVIKPDAATVQSTQWLCGFYKKYTYARPDGNIPEYCSKYN